MFQVEEKARARLQSRGKLDSVTQELKRAFSKEGNGENQDTPEQPAGPGPF